MTICLVVIGIIGSFCANDAQPVGNCYREDNHIYCTVEINELPARASWYNPAFCKDDEINTNCYYDENGDSTGDYLGDGTPTESAYGWAIACPPGLYGSIIDFEWAGTWECRDHGGAIHPTWGRWYTGNGFIETWVIQFDFLLESEAPFTYELLEIKNIAWPDRRGKSYKKVYHATKFSRND